MKRKVLEKKEAVRMRKEGRSVSEIQRALGVSKSNVSTWTRGVLTDDETNEKIVRFAISNQMLATQAASNRRGEIRKSSYEQGFRASQNASLLHTKGVMLYWAEGAKTGSTVKFSNTDPRMVKLFHQFLVEEMKIDKERLSVFFVYHGKDFEESNLESEEIALFWESLLGVGKGSVKGYPNRNKNSSGKTKNRHLYGICTLQYSCVKVFQRLMGAIEYYSLQKDAT